MAWTRPSLKELHERIAGDFSARLLDGGALLRRSVIAVLAKVWAGAAHAIHGVLQWLFLQVFPDTAEGDNMLRWASVWGLSRLPSAKAVGNVTFSGNEGAVLYAGTLMQDKGTGQQFQVLEDVTVTDLVAVAKVQAVDAGLAANVVAGTELDLISPQLGLISTGVVDSEGITGGYDAESDAALRARLLERLRRPPRGGSMADYVRWAKEVPGVTRAWCYPMSQGIGTVGVCFVCDNFADPIPTEEMIQRVRGHIEPLRPATVSQVEVFAPQTVTVDVTLKIKPDTPELRTAVTGEIADMLAREGAPGVSIYRSHISEAVSLTPLEVDHILVEPAADIIVPDGYFPILGEVTFQEYGD